MKTYYLFFLLIALVFFNTLHSGAQNSTIPTDISKNIEDLSIYPNPISNGSAYIFIASKLNLDKKVEFYNVLGKQIFKTHITGKQLNISTMSKGVYILKITENNISETRKLVIK